MKAAQMSRSVFAILAVAALAGCAPRLKSEESFQSAMTPNNEATGKTLDPYTYGGTAMASGGLHPQTRLDTPAQTAPVATPAAAKPAVKKK